jgi:antitoxin (DNA-binding transcriptional repressor) of toxin-antitoxin stability system
MPCLLNVDAIYGANLLAMQPDMKSENLNSMHAITIEDIQSDLSSFLDRIASGESLLIIQEDEPIAELKPVPRRQGNIRPFGLCAGEFSVPVDFDAPLPEEVLREFEGNETAA